MTTAPPACCASASRDSERSCPAGMMRLLKARHSEREGAFWVKGAQTVPRPRARRPRASSACSTGADARSSRMWFKNLRSDRVRDERLGAVARFDESPPADAAAARSNPPAAQRFPPAERSDPPAAGPAGKLITRRTPIGEHRGEVRESRCNLSRHAQHNRHQPLTSSRTR